MWEKCLLALQEHSTFAAILWSVGVPFVIIVTIWRWWTLRRQKSLPEAQQLLLFFIALSVFSILGYYAFLKILSYATRPWYYLPLLCAVAAAIEKAPP